MRNLLLISLVILIVSCNDDKIDRLESDVREMKQSLERIEAVLRTRPPLNDATTVSPGDSYHNSYKPPQKYPSSKSRCNAITKKGTQCSRSVRSGGYCWQHGG